MRPAPLWSLLSLWSPPTDVLPSQPIRALIDKFRLIREHWWVENKLHHVKDRTFFEDRHWVKNPATAQTFTFLRTLAADVLRRVRIPGGTGREHCPERIEYMRGDVWRPMRLVCGKNDF